MTTAPHLIAQLLIFSAGAISFGFTLGYVWHSRAKAWAALCGRSGL